MDQTHRGLQPYWQCSLLIFSTRRLYDGYLSTTTKSRRSLLHDQVIEMEPYDVTLQINFLYKFFIRLILMEITYFKPLIFPDQILVNSSFLDYENGTSKLR